MRGSRRKPDPGRPGINARARRKKAPPEEGAKQILRRVHPALFG
jgi:hypothetical protein